MTIKDSVKAFYKKAYENKWSRYIIYPNEYNAYCFAGSSYDCSQVRAKDPEDCYYISNPAHGFVYGTTLMIHQLPPEIPTDQRSFITGIGCAIEPVLIGSSDAMVWTLSDKYEKKKTIPITEGNGQTFKLIVEFRLSLGTDGFPTYGKIYKNGQPYGTERIEWGRAASLTNCDTYPKIYSEYLEFTTGDKVELWIHGGNGYACGFRVYKCPRLDKLEMELKPYCFWVLIPTTNTWMGFSFSHIQSAGRELTKEELWLPELKQRAIDLDFDVRDSTSPDIGWGIYGATKDDAYNNYFSFTKKSGVIGSARRYAYGSGYIWAYTSIYAYTMYPITIPLPKASIDKRCDISYLSYPDSTICAGETKYPPSGAITTAYCSITNTGGDGNLALFIKDLKTDSYLANTGKQWFSTNTNKQLSCTFIADKDYDIEMQSCHYDGETPIIDDVYG